MGNLDFENNLKTSQPNRIYHKRTESSPFFSKIVAEPCHRSRLNDDKLIAF